MGETPEELASETRVEDGPPVGLNETPLRRTERATKEQQKGPYFALGLAGVEGMRHGPSMKQTERQQRQHRYHMAHYLHYRLAHLHTTTSTYLPTSTAPSSSSFFFAFFVFFRFCLG
jgi:hypothetical protein